MWGILRSARDKLVLLFAFFLKHLPDPQTWQRDNLIPLTMDILCTLWYDDAVSLIEGNNTQRKKHLRQRSIERLNTKFLIGRVFRANTIELTRGDNCSVCLWKIEDSRVHTSAFSIVCFLLSSKLKTMWQRKLEARKRMTLVLRIAAPSPDQGETEARVNN